ncbi:hypothetical protein PtB15_14B210 [Puccinia triticina]|nr:hypothetical protein PtB15_14B210 [Puccinia triticina]
MFPPTRLTNWANPQSTANRYSKRTHAATQDPGKAAEAGQSGGSCSAAVDGRSSPAEAACCAQLLLPFNTRRLSQALQFVGPGSVADPLDASSPSTRDNERNCLWKMWDKGVVEDRGGFVMYWANLVPG